MSDVIVVGAGIGGLCAALELAARGLSVHVLEAAPGAGGKAGTVVLGDVEVDTGPSVLTLPHVFEELFSLAGRRLSDYVALQQPEPAFRYVYPDGTCLELHHEREATVASIEAALGSQARDEFTAYLDYSARIWETAAPNFVFGHAPELSRLIFSGMVSLGSLSRLDPLSSLQSAIRRRVKSPQLRRLFGRFATYNGSDLRRAPATLGCIAHVELTMGGFGVQGGMAQLARALERVCREHGVTFSFGCRVEEVILGTGPSVLGVRLASGERLNAGSVVVNADVGALRGGAIGLRAGKLGRSHPPSMSAHTGILRAARRERAGHTVLFAEDYLREFSDIFDRGRVPEDPTIYLCAQEKAHGREGWRDEEPIFVMVNAPALAVTREERRADEVRDQVLMKLQQARLIDPQDRILWWRTPRDLAERFPGSDGALYGAASNGPMAAFQRPTTRVPGVSGLYLASGSAHPGGGVPLVAQSGRLAASLVLRDLGRSVT